MTCPSLAHRPVVPAEVAACLRTAVASVARTTADAARRLVEGDRRTAQLARFAGAGVVATSVQVLLFALLASSGTLMAHVLSWAVSTALANELHRRRTFHAGARVGPLAAQLEGGGLAVLGLLITSASLAALTAALPDTGVGTQTLLVLGVTAAVGILRFAALRWSFVIRRPQPA